MLLADDPRFDSVMQFLEKAEYAEAIRQLDSLLEQLGRPKDRATALYWKIRSLTTLSRLSEARTYLEEALTLVDVRDPTRIPLKLASAFLLHAEEGPNKAVLELRSLLSRYAEEIKSPDFHWFFVQAKQDLGHCLWLAGRYAEAIKEFEEVLSLQEQPLSRYYIYFGLGDASNQLGDMVKAKDHFERALAEAEAAPKAGVSQYYSARIRYELALIAYKQHRYKDAARQLQFASAIAIKDAELLHVIEQLEVLVNQAKA
jgi:tetratricopeptide (TPR) repeat protein